MQDHIYTYTGNTAKKGPKSPTCGHFFVPVHDPRAAGGASHGALQSRLFGLLGASSLPLPVGHSWTYRAWHLGSVPFCDM